MIDRIFEFNIKEVLCKLPVAALFAVFLYLSSGLTRLAMTGLFIVSIIGIFLKKKYRLYFICLIFIVFIPLNLYADVQKSDDLFFYHPYNQSLYQKEFHEEGLYPDAYIREFVRDKRVIIPYKVKKYNEYVGNLSEEERAEHFEDLYYRENNLSRYFEEYAAECEVNEIHPDIRKIVKYVEGRDDYIDYGSANDMLRYSFLLNKETEKEMSYFWYSWYYYNYYVIKGLNSKVFIQKGLEDNDTCIAIWDRGENLCLMDLEHYEDYKKYAEELEEAKGKKK